MSDLETVDAYGTNAEGIQVFIGKVPMPANMKMKQIARSYFGHDDDDMDCCVGALEDFYAFINKQEPPAKKLRDRIEQLEATQRELVEALEKCKDPLLHPHIIAEGALLKLRNQK